MSSKTKPSPKPQAPKPPKGTRDLYPADLLKSRYIQNAWRDASLRCGFDEIEGPTFETTDLYSIKSGEGILGELFQAFSGKSPKEVEQVQETGRAPFALRPEFTPTLARMYAARAKELSKPCKWFTAGPYFRAERPQRGRLREFLQWNCDIIGGSDDANVYAAHQDVEAVFPMVLACESFGFTAEDIRVKFGSRKAIENSMVRHEIDLTLLEKTLAILDARPKMRPQEYEQKSTEIGLPHAFIQEHHPESRLVIRQNDTAESVLRRYPESDKDEVLHILSMQNKLRDTVGTFTNALARGSLREWSDFDSMIIRGLAYYTGTVFELIADGERAVAGGGRYDNLIELMGGPPTPAVGFAMGDVVLGNLLEDKGLMPEGVELMEAVARPQASIRPVAFVVPNGDEDNESLVHTLVANLRRGIESEDWLGRDDRKPWQRDRYTVAPLHARVSYKSTRNMGKLRRDAENQHARYFVEIHGDDKVEITNMDTRESLTSAKGSFHIDPSESNYAGKAIAERL